MVAVFEAVVIVPPPATNVGAASAVPPEVASASVVIVSVTPAGTLLNVNRIFDPFGVDTLLFELCAAVRQHEAQPSVRVNDPVLLTVLRFVKSEAVPAEPILIADIPALDPFWIVALDVVKM